MKHRISSAIRRAPFTSLALLASYSGSAFPQVAQDTATPRESASSTEVSPSSTPVTRAAPAALKSVTVTAERRTENIKDVPSSISILSGEKLDVLNSSGEDIRALSGRVPSLNIESSFGRTFPRFYIRGYGNTDFHLNASQPVSLVYDDVVLENALLKGFPLFDIQDVEVLAGPQGTLFGRNTPAGVVKITSVPPSQTKGGYFNASYGRFGTSNLEGAFNLPLGDGWSSRISLQSEHRDPWVTNTAPIVQTKKLEGYDDNAVRLQVLYAPTQDFSALINAHGRVLSGTARLFRANIIQRGTNNLVEGFDPSKTAFDGLNRQKLNSSGIDLSLRWRLGDVALHSITGVEHVSVSSRADIDGGYGAVYAPPFGPGFIPFSSETEDRLKGHQQLTQEFRVESLGSAPLQWQTGLYLFHEKFGIYNFTYDTLFGGPPTSVQSTQRNNAWAVFGSGSYAVLSDLKLRAGIRYTQDRKSLTSASADTALNTTNGLSQSTSDSKVNGDLSATYAVTKDANLYARIATGFRGSSIYPASAFGPLTFAPPETTTSYEIGLKMDLLEKQARLSVSLFNYEVKNQQLTAVGGATNDAQLLSAKKAVGRGAELNLDAYLTDHLIMTFNGSYNFTKIQDPNIAVTVCPACTVTNRTGTVQTAGGPATVAFIDGNPLPQAPKWIANVTARYTIPSADSSGEYFVYTDWSYRSKVNFLLYRAVEYTGKPLVIGGLRAGYDWQGGKYEVALFARNITNQIRVTGGLDFNNLTGFINDPRTYGVQFKSTF